MSFDWIDWVELNQAELGTIWDRLDKIRLGQAILINFGPFDFGNDQQQVPNVDGQPS